MGAEFNLAMLDEELTREQVREKVHEMIEEAAWESGHGGYTGTWAECTGVAFDVTQFGDAGRAEQYLQDKAQKWGPALVVKCTNCWMVGAWCSS